VDQHTEPGTVLGTVGYMSPEQLRGAPADQRSDIFALGAVLYEMLAGRRAFRGDSAIETMNAILKEEPPELLRSGKSVPPALERIVTHCLEKRPEQRFQSARDIAFDLESVSTTSSSTIPASPAQARRIWVRRAAILAAAAGALILAFLAGRGTFRGAGDLDSVRFRRLTFRRENLLHARFTPDGRSVVYGSAVERKPSEVFSVRTDSVEPLPLGIPNADPLSVSSKGELAVLLKRAYLRSTQGSGTLARVPLGGGTPREIAEKVWWAEWAPDAQDLAVIRQTANGWVLEYPLGQVRVNSASIGEAHFSPTGDLAFVDGGTGPEHGRALWILNGKGEKRELTKGWRYLQGFAWAPGGREIFFVGWKGPDDSALRAVDLEGRVRTLLPGWGQMILRDVAADGRILVEFYDTREGILCLPAGEKEERELGWSDKSYLADLSLDGSAVLFQEQQDAGGKRPGVYLRRTDGSPAVRLGEGIEYAYALSPDGRWAAAATPKEIVLLPTGPGSPRRFPLRGVSPEDVTFLPDGKHLIVQDRSDPKEPLRIHVVPIDGGPARQIDLTGSMAGSSWATSPDGERIAYGTPDGQIRIGVLSEGGQPPRTVPEARLGADEWINQWSVDDALFLNRGDAPMIVSRIEIATGRRSLWKEIAPADFSGVRRVYKFRITPDGRTYAYDYERVNTNTLFIIEGIR
jgi:Tol biopolymer transport system component